MEDLEAFASDTRSDGGMEFTISEIFNGLKCGYTNETDANAINGIPETIFFEIPSLDNVLSVEKELKLMWRKPNFCTCS